MWQPIETAPKDQTFLAVLNCAGQQTICTMRWAVAEEKNSRPDHSVFHVERVTHWMPLPDLPGAQPAPSVPEGWKPIPEEHQTFDLVDLRLADGSVLCGCVPQSDGDYWWEGPSGEVFIDPKYAPVTHWRLAAAPEAKPSAHGERRND
jgi:hypothetical protein